MKDLSISNFLSLSIAERIQLVCDLWDSVAAIPGSVDLTEPQKEELEKRLNEYRNNPDAGSPWETVKTRIRINS